MLEQHKKSTDRSITPAGAKQMTHMISCRGSDIFLHALGVQRSPLDDAPPLAEMFTPETRSGYRVNVCRVNLHDYFGH